MHKLLISLVFIFTTINSMSVYYSENDPDIDYTFRGRYYITMPGDTHTTSRVDYCIIGAKGIYFCRDKISVTVDLVLKSKLEGVPYNTMVLKDGRRFSIHYLGNSIYIIQILTGDSIDVLTCGRYE